MENSQTAKETVGARIADPRQTRNQLTKEIRLRLHVPASFLARGAHLGDYEADIRFGKPWSALETAEKEAIHAERASASAFGARRAKAHEPKHPGGALEQGAFSMPTIPIPPGRRGHYATLATKHDPVHEAAPPPDLSNLAAPATAAVAHTARPVGGRGTYPGRAGEPCPL